MDPMSARTRDHGDLVIRACSACHRRKLKCDKKVAGCSACLKSNIPCIYTTPSNKTDSDSRREQVKRKRGPYNKGKTPREKELEHVIELLQEKGSELQLQKGSSSPASASNGNVNHDSLATSTIYTPGQGALGHVLSLDQQHFTKEDRIHPVTSHILELWTIYRRNVDPLTKVIHCPTFEGELLATYNTPLTLPSSTQTLLLSISFAAIKSLTPSEVFSKIGKSKDELLAKYCTDLDKALDAADQADGVPSLEMLQAADIYLATIRRQHNTNTDVQSLFALAVRLARRLELDEAATYYNATPFASEMYRRAWWGLCRHESSHAEELNRRLSSIMQTIDVPLPGNYDDEDLYPALSVLPTPRPGLSNMSFCLLSFEVIRLVSRLAFCTTEKPRIGGFLEMKNSKELRAKCESMVQETRARLEQGILQHCDISRTCDYLMLLTAKILLTKVEILLLEPPASGGQILDKFHDIKVALALDIIECHQIIISEHHLERYAWKYKGLHQWYACTYVLEELCRRPYADFAARAWQVIDLVIASSDLQNIDGLKEGDRVRLLEVHASAIAAQVSQQQHDTDAAERGLSVHEANISTLRSEPWQLDQSLFDLQDVQMNMNVFFPWSHD